MRAAVLCACILFILPAAAAAADLELTRDGQPLEFVKEGAEIQADLRFTPSDGSRLAQITSDQLAGSGGVRLATAGCTRCNASVTIIGSQQLTFRIQEDIDGNIVESQKEYQLRVDGEPPVISEVRIGHCTSGCPYSSEQNTVTFSVSDTQSGVSPEGIRVRVNGAPNPFSCGDAQGRIVCETNITATSDVELQIAASDHVTNTAVHNSNPRYDGTPPSIIEEPAFLSGSERLPGGLDSSLRMKVEEPERANIRLEAPFGNSTGTCERIDDETNSLECTVTFTPPNERKRYDGRIVVTDAAGNTRTRGILLDVYESEGQAEPNFWEIDTDARPRVDVRTWQALDKTFVIPLELDPIQSTGAEPVSLNAECEWPGTVEGAIRVDSIAPSKETLMLLTVGSPRPQDIQEGEYRGSNITCTIKTTTRIGSTIFTNPEQDRIDIRPQLLRIPDPATQLQEYEQNIQDNLDREQRSLRKAEGYIFAMEQVCETPSAVQVAALVQMVTAQSLDGSVFGAGAGRVIEESGDQTEMARHRLQEAVADLCFTVTCDLQSRYGEEFLEGTGLDSFWEPGDGIVPDGEADDDTSRPPTGSPDPGHIVRSSSGALDGSAPDGYSGIHNTFAVPRRDVDVQFTPLSDVLAPSPTQSDEEGSGWSYSTEGMLKGTLQGMGLQLGPKDIWDPYRSKYVAMATMCAPAYVAHEYAEIQTQCAYQSCVQTAGRTGRSLRECAEDRAYQECVSHRGALYFAAPLTGAFDQVLSSTQTIIENPGTLAVPVASVVCEADGFGVGPACKVLEMGKSASEMTSTFLNIKTQVERGQRVIGGGGDICRTAESAEEFLANKVAMPHISGVDACKAGYSVFEVDGTEVVGVNDEVYTTSSSEGREANAEERAAAGLSGHEGTLRIVRRSDPLYERAHDIHGECQERIEALVSDYPEEFDALKDQQSELEGLEFDLSRLENPERADREQVKDIINVNDYIAENIPSDEQRDAQELLREIHRAVQEEYERGIEQKTSGEEYDFEQALSEGPVADALAEYEAEFGEGAYTLPEEDLIGAFERAVLRENERRLIEEDIEELEEEIKAKESELRRQYMQDRLGTAQGFTQETFSAMLGYARAGKLFRQYAGFSPFGTWSGPADAVAGFRESLQNGETLGFACSIDGQLEEAAVAFGSPTGGVSARVSAAVDRTDAGNDYVIDLYVGLPRPPGIDPEDIPEAELILTSPHDSDPLLIIPLAGETTRVGSNAVSVRVPETYREACIVFPSELENFFAVTGHIDGDSDRLCTTIQEARR